MSGVCFLKFLKVIFLLSPFEKLHHLLFYVSILFATFFSISMFQMLCALKFVRGRAGRPARPRTQHDSHHNTKVKPETATTVTELMIMGGKTPETC